MAIEPTKIYLKPYLLHLSQSREYFPKQGKFNEFHY